MTKHHKPLSSILLSRLQIHDGNSRWDAISHCVTSILRRLKHAIRRREDFESQRQELVVWLTEIDLRLTNVEHLSQQGNHEKLTEIRVRNILRRTVLLLHLTLRKLLLSYGIWLVVRAAISFSSNSGRSLYLVAGGAGKN